MAVKVIFVFDGPNRPTKRKRKLSSNEHYLIQSFCIMVHAFGFEFHTAPGEAEAELAIFERLNIIDAVMTDDSDIFLFGAKTVIRNRSAKVQGSYAKNKNGKEDDDHLFTFELHNFIHDGVALTPGSFILIGLLSGGDYSNGVPGIGIKTAVQIHEFGASLLTAVENSDETELENILIEWRNNLVTELTNGTYPNGISNLARALPPTFPDREALHYYTHPLISKLNPQEFKSKLWKKKFDLGSVAHIGEYYFGWDGPMKLFPYLHRRICRIFILQKLVELSVDIDRGRHDHIKEILPFLLKICHSTERVSMDYVAEYRIIAQFQTLIPVIRARLTELRQLQSNNVLLFLRGPSAELTDENMAIFTRDVRIYIPKIIIDFVLPKFVVSQRPFKDKAISLKIDPSSYINSGSESEDLPSAEEIL